MVDDFKFFWWFLFIWEVIVLIKYVFGVVFFWDCRIFWKFGLEAIGWRELILVFVFIYVVDKLGDDSVKEGILIGA